MPLAPGQSLSFYEIVAPLGAGGMGEVYRARDTRLDREVAIKVLPEELGEDEERLRRFEREAKTLASLNHPNVAGIHGVDSQGDVYFLALELVPGEDLATRLKRGALPVDEGIDVCRQIAEGLEAAHEAGVVHRDLKPANVRITPEGVVKILDFGLAKPLRSKASSAGTSIAESDSFLMTEEGLVLGTPTYMSSEQARGKPVDRRTDIWAFGCVLFECLTGKRAFGGESVTDVLAAILEHEPDWAVLPVETPRHVRTLLSRCLDKDPRRRLRDIGEARVLLERPTTDFESSTGGGRRALLPWGIALAAVVIAAAAMLGSSESDTRPEVVGLTLPVEFPNNRVTHPFTLSPDGTLAAYREDREGSFPLVLRSLDDFESRPVVGGEGAIGPFFSPDGRRLAFFARGQLWSVEVAGGSPRSICDVSTSTSTGVWSDDGNIYFVQWATASGVYRVPARGGAAVEVFPRNADSVGFMRRPRLLPGGEGLAIESYNLGLSQTLLKFFDGAPGVSIDRPQVTYLPGGEALFVEAGRLFRAGYDPTTYQITGDPVALVENVVEYVITPSGSLAYRSGPAELDLRMVRTRRDGTSTVLAEFDRAFSRPAVSPDGAMVVTHSTEGIHLWDARRGTRRLLSVEGYTPQWGADGNTIYFQVHESLTFSFHRMTLDSSAPSERLLSTQDSMWLTDISPDGSALLYYTIHPQTERDIWILPLDERAVGDGDAEPRCFLATPASERSAVFSPDGLWIAYLSDITGRDEVYVRPADGEGAEVIVTPAGGREPRWSHDGKELYYRVGDGLWAVPVTTDPRFSVGEPSLLFRERLLIEEGGRNQQYDVFPNGDFLMLTAPARGDELRIVTHWLEELP